MSMASTDKGLLTPDNCAVVFIDHQAQMFGGVASIGREDLLRNLLVLAKAARIFGLPVILTAVACQEYSGILLPQLRDLFPGETPIARTSINAWDDHAFVAAVRRSGRRNFVLSALWSETCLAFPALQMLEEGYGVYAVEDASGGLSRVAHAAAIRRIEQAGGVSLTALQLLLELQRDWSRQAHSAEVMAVIEEHCEVCGEVPTSKVEDRPEEVGRGSSESIQ
jgi:nicotinamidase-related amidase